MSRVAHRTKPWMVASDAAHRCAAAGGVRRPGASLRWSAWGRRVTKRSEWMARIRARLMNSGVRAAEE